jgi:predicted RecA/RadA family phage recombinase
MFTEAANLGEGLTINHTPSSALVAGQMLKVGGRAAFACEDIAASALGAVQVEGHIKAAAVACVGNVGDNVWWDENGSPYGGTASAGGITTIASDGDFWVGILTKALTATDGEAEIALNQVNPELPAWPTRYHITDVTGTLDNTDGGVVHHIMTADQTITLPEIATVYIGMEVIIQVDTADAGGSVGLIVAPHANDGFNGFGITHAVNKSLTNTEATAKRGDYLRLQACGDTHWQVIEKRGIWARAS